MKTKVCSQFLRLIEMRNRIIYFTYSTYSIYSRYRYRNMYPMQVDCGTVLVWIKVPIKISCGKLCNFLFLGWDQCTFP